MIRKGVSARPGPFAALVVLPNIAIRLVEKFLVRVQFVLEQSAAKFFLHQPLPLARVLPIGKAHFFDDVVDIRNDAFHDNMGVGVLGLAKKLREGFLGAVALLLWIGFSLRLDHLFGDFKNGLSQGG
jgi:hypothetical protein